MPKNTPIVSVLMPTFNRVNLLGRAMQSVLSQSFKDLELIVINDASTDSTRKFLDDLAKNDPRVRPIHNEKNNYPDISKNLNSALGIARGNYIARLDDDDYWCDSDKLKKQVDFLDSHPAHVVIGGGTIVVDGFNKERFRYYKLETDEEIRSKVLFANPFTHSTVMFRAELAREVGGYGNFKNAEDWDLWLKMGVRGKFYNNQEYFVRYLMTDENKTFVFKKSQSREILEILKLHKTKYPNFYPAFFFNRCQYLYSFFPVEVRRSLNSLLSRAKRTLFT